MKLFFIIFILSTFCSLLDARKRPKPFKFKPKLSCTGTNGEKYLYGQGYTIGCLEYMCGKNGKLNVDINPTCCLYKGNYYQVDEVVKEIPYGENCVLEQMVCKGYKGGQQIVKEPAYGKCHCEYNGKTINEGDNITLSSGRNASCCNGVIVIPFNNTSKNSEVKLLGGSKPGMGDVYLNDVPVDACNWDKNAATILCHDLGFGDVIEIPKRSKKTFSKNSNNNFHFSIKCDGNEESFNQCKIIDDCHSGEVASVRCSRVKVEENSLVRLDGDPLCADKLNEIEATALCRELGFSSGILYESVILNTKISSKYISCSGMLLSTCSTTECGKESMLAALNCTDKMDIQLMGGNGENEGNVYFRGGPVCDDDFNITDADVICRELGFDQAEFYTNKSHYGVVDLPFTLDNINCKGTEVKLDQCESIGSEKSNCQNNEGAGVKCTINKNEHNSRRKRSALAAAQAAPAIMDSGANIVGGVMNYFAEKEKQHQAYLKERPDKVDLSNDKLSIKMKPSKGYMDVDGEFNQGGFELNIGNESPAKKEKKDGGPAFIHTGGIGPMLMNGCFGTNYSVGDPCYASKKLSTKCLDMIESANYVGVGFDGTGEYTHASRKKSLIQRECASKGSYHGEDVPDNMNIFGIYDTACSGKTFQSIDARSAYQRKQSDMGSNEDYLRYQGGSHTSFSASLGFGTASASASHSSYGNKYTYAKNKRQSMGSAEKNEETTKKMIFEFTCTIRRYNIFLDEVRPEQLSEAFLEDYMSLPIRYYDFRQQAPLRYNRFLQRWGTHYIKSATFGGKFTLLRESILHGSETQSEFQERAQEDATEMFGAKKSSWNAQADYSVWSASVEGSVSTNNQQTSDTYGTASRGEAEENIKRKQASKYSMDDIIVEGGHQKVASILADKNRAGFKGEFQDWLDSIPEYPKGYDFKFGKLNELLDINYRSLLNNKFEPCWKYSGRYDLKDDRGDLICKNCLYNTTVKNDDGTEIVEVRKCQFQNLDDFQDQMDRKLLSLKRAIDIFAKNGGGSATEVTLPGGISQCENHNITYKKITYKELISGEAYRINFDLRGNIGEEIERGETIYISFKHDDDDDNDGGKMGRWAVGDSASDTFAGQYSRKIKVDEASKIVLVNGVQFSYDSGKSGNYLIMTRSDCEKNKVRIASMAYQSCNETEDIHWINLPLATVRSIKSPETFYPCFLEWSNANMLMSESSCVRFTATSEGPIYFALATIPNRPDTMYYLRISPTDVTIYKKSSLMDTKTKDISAVGLGHKDIFQSYIICSEHEKKKDSLTRYTRITYGKLEADENINRDATLNAYLIMEDDDSPIEPTFFAFGSGEEKVQIVDLELLDVPNINCRGNTILYDGNCIQACEISKIAAISRQTVDIKCYKEDADEEYNHNTTFVGEGSFCVPICQDNEVAYPNKTVCKGDSSWTNKLNCHKECDKNDIVITKGQFIIDGREEIDHIMDLKIECPNAINIGDLSLIITGVKCQVYCGTGESGLLYNSIEDIECSDTSHWLIASKKFQHICRSFPCSSIMEVPNGNFSCNETVSNFKGSNYNSEGTICKLNSCNERYIPNEPSTITCSNGEWRHGENVTTLQCRERSCVNGVSITKIEINGRRVEVRCEDGEGSNGAWTVIQHRKPFDNNKDYFYKSFSQYENGFGSVEGELWLGLKNLEDLTSVGMWELQVDLTDWDNVQYQAVYRRFSIGPGPRYELNAANFDDAKSTLGDTLKYHHGEGFTTFDKTQHTIKNPAIGNCAQFKKGAWWYNEHCLHSNLNGQNFDHQITKGDEITKGMTWFAGKNRGNSYRTWRESVMKIRRSIVFESNIICTNGVSKTVMEIDGRIVEVSCEDGDGSNGAWTVIQRRKPFDNTQDYFYKSFFQYENGFGSVDGELWLGLKNLEALTSVGIWELQVDLTDWDNVQYQAVYRQFSIGSGPRYELNVGNFDDAKSTLGDTLKYHQGEGFTTFDKTQHTVKNPAIGNCAQFKKGAWWYNEHCLRSNLNGQNFDHQIGDFSDEITKGMTWFDGKNRGNSYRTWRESVMKIRNVNA